MARKKKFAPNDNNLAIAYYRFSSHSQNEASIDQQRELAHEWADTHGLKIVKEYEDAAISGTTDARPGFQQMLSEVAKIRPHTLIMWKTDRLGRDKYVLAMAKKKIRDAGCEIHLLAEHIPTEGPEGVLIEGLMEAMAEYYEKSHDDTAYLEALEAKRREVEKSLANLVKVIERGVVSDTVTQRLAQLEEQKSALNDAIGTENVRVSLCEDRHSIQAYFDKFLHADVNDPEIRDQVFEYFVDKVYLYDDKLVVSMWFSEDDRQEITWRDWFSLDEYWTDESPFVKGGGVEFDCFPLGSTKDY